MAEVLSLGGRFYVPAEATTFAQDAAFMALVYESNVHQEIADGGDIIAAVLRSGKVPEFLACALVPMDGTWSAEGAKDAAAHFAGLTDPAEKSALMQALSVVIVGFFTAATPSAPSSPSALAETMGAAAAAPRRRRSRAVDIGAASSLPSPITTGAEPVT